MEASSPTDWFAQRQREYEEEQQLLARRTTQLEDIADSMRNGTFQVIGPNPFLR
jgi:hypothetical protein